MIQTDRRWLNATLLAVVFVDIPLFVLADFD